MNNKRSPMNEELRSAFSSRRDRFIASLERVMTSVASDKYIRQMFEDSRSAIYVPDRVCELIQRVMDDDREKIVSLLTKKLHAIEYFFDQRLIARIEEIGMRHVDSSEGGGATRQNDDTNEFCKIIVTQLSLLSRTTAFDEMQNAVKSVKANVIAINADFVKALSAAKKKALSYCRNYEKIVKRRYAEKYRRAKFMIREQRTAIERLSASNSSNVSINSSPNASMRDDSSATLILRYKQKDTDSVSSNLTDTMSIQQEIKDLKKKLSQIKIEKNELMFKNRELAYINNALKNKLAFLGHNVELIKNPNGEIIIKSDNNQKGDENLNSSIDKQSNNINMNDLIQQIDILKDERSKLTEKEGNLEKSLNEITQKLEKKKEKIKGLKQQINDLMNSKNEIKDQLNESIQALQQKIDQMTVEKESFNTEKKQLEEKFKDDQTSLDKIKQIFGNLNNPELLQKISSLSQQNAEIKKILKLSKNEENNPISKIDAITKTQNEIQSILNVKDQSKIQPEVQSLIDFKKQYSQFFNEMIDIIDANNVFTNNNLNKSPKKQDKEKSDKEKIETELIIKLKENIRLLLRTKQIFDTLCEKCDLPNDSSSVQKIQKSVKIVKDLSNKLKLNSSSDLFNEINTILVNNDMLKNNIQKFFDIFKINDHFQNITGDLSVKLEQYLINIMKKKAIYDTILKDLDIYDDSIINAKIQELKNSKLMIENICDLLNTDQNSIQPIIKSLLESQNILRRAFILLNVKDNDSFCSEIQTLHLAKISMKSPNSNKSLQPDTFQELLKAGNKYNEVLMSLSGHNAINQNEDFDAAQKIKYMKSCIDEIYSILKIENNNNIEFQAKNICNIIRRNQEFCNVIKSYFQIDDTVKIKEELAHLRNTSEFSNEVEKCFKSHSIKEIQAIKKKYDNLLSLKKVMFNLIQKFNHDFNFKNIDDIENCSLELIKSIDLTSQFYKRLISLIIGTNLLDDIQFPMIKSQQDKLFSLITDFKVENERMHQSVDRVVDQARYTGFLGRGLEDAVAFICDEQREKIAKEYEYYKRNIDQKVEETKHKYKIKIYNLEAALKNFKNSIGESNSFFKNQYEALRVQLEESNEQLHTEKRIHQELISILSGQIEESEFLKTKLSARELLILANSEKTRKFNSDNHHIFGMQTINPEGLFDHFSS